MSIIDFLTLLLVNMVAGLVLLAFYLYKGIVESNQKKWIPGFLITGFIALINGLWIIWHWPLPGSFNIAYGEMSVLFGTLFLGFAISIMKEWEIFSVTIYAIFAGLASITIGFRIINLHMTNEPMLAGIGFILSGLVAVLSYPTVIFKNIKALRLIVMVIILITAGIWAMTAYPAYWKHLADFSKWVPLTMK
jgi:putative membrane protein